MMDMQREWVFTESPERICHIYFNPDAGSGNQFVHNYYSTDLVLHELKSANMNFREALSFCEQYSLFLQELEDLDSDEQSKKYMEKLDATADIILRVPEPSF